jgi:hypothetical protein
MMIQKTWCRQIMAALPRNRSTERHHPAGLVHGLIDGQVHGGAHRLSTRGEEGHVISAGSVDSRVRGEE